MFVVDDGAAPGATVRVALRAIRKARAAPIMLAVVPVAPVRALEALRPDVDAVVCLANRSSRVGAYYRDFTQVSDEEVVDLLAAAPAAP